MISPEISFYTKVDLIATDMKEYIFDTNIYDLILVDNVNIDALNERGKFYITNIQISEIKNIGKSEKRVLLLQILDKLKPAKLQLMSGIWLDDLHWDDDQPWIDDINEECHNLRGNSSTNWKDALIGEVAIKKELILVTSDEKFEKRAQKNNIKTLTYASFLVHVGIS